MVVGEKKLYINRYELGDWHDDIGWTDGWDPDIVRYTGLAPGPDEVEVPGRTVDPGYNFGSAHSAGINTVFADGHAVMLAYGIDPTVFNYLGDRRDGNTVSLP
jgi:prepilin-type processing-associated H-X9-DG protein